MSLKCIHCQRMRHFSRRAPCVLSQQLMLQTPRTNSTVFGVLVILQVVTLNEQLRELRAIVDKARRRETAALSELTRYEANNAQRVEQVQALLAAAAWSPGTSRGGSEDGEDKFVGRGDFVIGSGAGAEAWAPGLGRLPLPTGGGANDGTLPELAALGEAITDRSREVTDLKVSKCMASYVGLSA